MKKIIHVSSIVVILLAVAAIVMSAATSVPASAQPLSLKPPLPAREALPPFSGFPLDQTRQVEVDIDKQAFALLTQREQRDQVLDWLLFTVLSDSGLSLEEINQASFDLPAIRYGYLQPSAKLEYGQTRSSQIGDGRIVALIPANKPEERTDLLGYIADHQRTNTGKMPTELLVFEYELSPDLHSSTVTRKADVSGIELFSPSYGYYQFKVSDLQSLEQVLDTLDDITFAEVSGQELVIGGRDLSSQSMLGVGTEDVAAIWQAFVQVDKRNQQFCTEWKNKFDKEFESDIGLSFYLDRIDPCKLLEGEDPGNIYLSSLTEQQLQSFLEEMILERESLGIIGGLGFSLDPYYDFDGLHQFFSEKRAGYEEVVAYVTTFDSSLTAVFDLNSIDLALAEENAIPYLDFAQKLGAIALLLEMTGETVQAEKAYALSDETAEALDLNYQYQAARYDGNLQGTEVGMTLFYTDLLAKLWSFDYQGSAPREIEDFIPETEIRLSEVFRKELTDFPSTRLWFGPRKQAFQLGSDRINLLFDRIATRVFAASSDPLEPGQEVAANAPAAKYLGWWNDHYGEVAEYEPQYERLNAIMKWSLLISWLGDSDQESLLGYLAGVPVNRSYRFPEWVQTQPQLRYQQWDAIAFHAPGYLNNTTETLPILVSEAFNTFPTDSETARASKLEGIYHLLGGVSLADQYLFRTVKPIPGIADDLLLRPGLGSYTEGLLQTVDDITYEFTNLADEVFLVTANLPEGVKFRGPDNDLINKPIKRLVSQRSLEEGLEFGTQIDEVPVGSLKVARDANGFRVGWASRDIDQAQQFARQLSEDVVPLKAFDDPAVRTVIELPGELPGERNFLVNFKGTDRWMRISDVSDAAFDDTTRIWQSRLASLKTGDRIVGIQWEGDILAPLRPGGQSYLVGSLDDTKYFTLSIQNLPNSVKPLNIQVGDMKISAWVDPQSKQIYYSFNDLPETLQTHPELLKNLVRSTDLPPDIADAFNLTVYESRLGDLSPFARGFSEADYPLLARKIIDNPTLFYAEKNAFLEDALKSVDDWIQSGRSSEALTKLDELTGIYGARPELVLRKSLLWMDKGQTSQLANELNRLASRPVDDLVPLLDEVNFRLGAPPAGLDSANLYKMGQSLEWQNFHANKLIHGGEVQIAFTGKKLDFHYVLDAKPSGPALQTVNINSNVPVYVQDSPALSNLDWQVSVNNSLNQVVSGNMGKVIVLPRGDIAFYKPTEIFDPGGLTYGLIQHGDEIVPTQLLRFSLLNYTEPKCDPNDVNMQQNCVVFVIADQ